MKKNILGPVIIALTIFFVYSSCTKIDTTDLGNELIPAVDNVNTFETFLDVETNNVFFSGDTPQMPYSLNHAIGIIENDPDFGKTEAALYFGIAPLTFGSYPFVNKDALVAVDSIVLSLAYKSLYGDSQSIQRFEVFEVDPTTPDFRYLDSSDYTINHSDFPILPVALGARTVNFQTLNDSLIYKNAKDTVRAANELRIHLNTSFATRFTNADTTNAYKNDSIFKTVLKGLAVKINSGGSPSKNALAYFDINDAKTRLTFYCRVKNNGVDSAIAPFFDFTSSRDAQANLIKRTPSGAYLATINNSNTNDPVLYLQNTPGSYATLKIAGIDTLTNRVIHRAEITVDKLTPISETFNVPEALFIDVVRNGNDSIFPPTKDFVVTGNGTYDINLIGGRFKDNKYVFNISRHLQNIVTNKAPNYSYRIYAPFITRPYVTLPTGITAMSFLVNSSIAGGRVVVAGGSHPTKKMRLRIIYSKI